MAFLDDPINVDEIPQTEPDFKPIPAGWYNAKITNAELKPTSTGGQRIAVRYDITGPQHEGRVVFSGFNVRNNNEEAVRISREQLGQLMRATGLGRLDNTDQLVGAQCQIKVKVTAARDGYEAGNDVGGYKALEGSMPPSVGQSAPSGDTGSGGASGGTGSGTGSKAPWQR